MLPTHSWCYTAWSDARLTRCVFFPGRPSFASLWIRASNCNASARRRWEPAPLSALLINCSSDGSPCWAEMARRWRRCSR